MKQYFNVKGTSESVSALQVDVDTVYLRSNIQRIETEDFVGWQYDEVQYELREYIESLADKQKVNDIEMKLLTADERYKLLDLSIVTVEDLKQYKIAQLKELCSNSIYNGFTSSVKGYSFNFNELDQANFTQQLLLIVASNGNYTNTIKWKTKDMQVVDLTVEEFTTILGEAELHKRTEQNKYWQLESKVLSALTIEEVDNINWV